MQIIFPTLAAHYCEDFYPEPEKFKPERFLKENAENLDPINFRPFGGEAFHNHGSYTYFVLIIPNFQLDNACALAVALP